MSYFYLLFAHFCCWFAVVVNDIVVDIRVTGNNFDTVAIVVI